MSSPEPVTSRRVLSIWWPLAGSWLLMGLEMPAFVAAASRLPDSAANLAAFNSVVYPISMVIEGPIVMLLAASTALVEDRTSYRKLRRFTIAAALALTVVHALIAFTPLYDVIARDWIGIASEAVEPGRTGLRIMLPWSAAIAYRRFQQGVLIRYGRPRAVVAGTLVRLATVSTALIMGVCVGADGVVVGASAIAAGVLAEAVFASLQTRSIIARHMPEDAAETPLSAGRFVRFYAPLALTPFMTLALQPITAWAIWRMPDALPSSASWGAVYGFIFLFRALGFAFQEVTVSLSKAPGGPAALQTFANRLAIVATTAFALIALTPLGTVWFAAILDLTPDLTSLGCAALPFGILMPALATLQNYRQGQLVAAHRTRAITQAVVIYLVLACVLFGVAAAIWPFAGIHGALLVLTTAGAAQLAWLWVQARRTPGIIDAS